VSLELLPSVDYIAITGYYYFDYLVKSLIVLYSFNIEDNELNEDK